MFIGGLLLYSLFAYSHRPLFFPSKDFPSTKTISVTIRGAVFLPNTYSLPLGTTRQQLLEQAGVRMSGDLTGWEGDRPLQQGEVVTVPKQRIIEVLVCENRTPIGLLFLFPGLQGEEIQQIPLFCGIKKRGKIRNRDILYVSTQPPTTDTHS